MTAQGRSDTALQLRSIIKKGGKLELSLARIPVPQPGPDEVVIRVEATPINPSDLGLMFGPADMTTARVEGEGESTVVSADVPERFMGMVAGRIDQSLPVGNEGAGVVVATGSSDEARALLGKTVAVSGGAMYAQARVIKARECLVLPEGTTPKEGASCYVNPLTVLGMVETMRREGHKALVHTAAASNLGQMLNRLCLEDGIELVNVVRKQEQVELLQGQGAKYVCNSSAPSFLQELTEALAETGATLAFDAVGGGELASQILSCMEAAAARTLGEYSRYGSTVYKQVYIYGGLDRGPTLLRRAYGTAWGLGGWLLPIFLQKIGFEAAQKLRQRVADEIKTTFASSYTKEISLVDVLRPEEIAVYGQQATGKKYLIRPNAAGS